MFLSLPVNNYGPNSQTARRPPSQILALNNQVGAVSVPVSDGVV